MTYVERLSPWSPDDQEALHRDAPHMVGRYPKVSMKRDHDQIRFELTAPWWRNPPPPHLAGSCDRLWEYEVVEVFFVGEGGRYLELEVGPYGHHLALQLSAPRVVTARDLPLTSLTCERIDVEKPNGKSQNTPQSTSQSDISTWSARGSLDRALLPPPVSLTHGEGSGWYINVFWCFSLGMRRHHWCATPLPGERPDFHQPEHFSLHLSSEQEHHA